MPSLYQVNGVVDLAGQIMRLTCVKIQVGQQDRKSHQNQFHTSV